MSKVKAHYYTDWDREMATKKPSSRKKDKTYPGQLKFQLDDDLLKIVEENGVESSTTTACTPEVSRAYWESLSFFLMHRESLHGPGIYIHRSKKIPTSMNSMNR